ncbi:hypothetical protein J6D24_00820 [Candidatus Saccharibacteria bacterium]|nr:hypothetical protein [Candidatus Saccharibacteria bacterium]
MQTEETRNTAVGADTNLEKVVEKINDADSILVTLSKDPSVDEMTAALGLTLMLDKYGKHVTAIYSGKTPNALEFLRPDETFETNTNSLQDFIIALEKEKADHLRYKIEGDFVKVYITPYKTTISESDLEFSRGEVNVDLVIAIDVIEIEDLDAALSQHGRIMHDAGLINISNAVPGRLGGVEWNKPQASSVSEMVVELVEKIGQQPISKEAATALLTGIISATDRFSNEKTTPDTMALSSKLMQLGADQQLIVAQMGSAEPAASSTTETPAEEAWKGEAETSTMEGPTMEASAEDKASEPGMLDVKHEEDSVESGLTPEQQLEQMIRGDNPETPNVSAGSVMEELKSAVPETPAPEAPAVEAPTVETPVAETPAVELPTLGSPEVSEFAPTATPVEPENDATMVAAVPQSKVEANTIYGTDMDRTLMQDKTMTPLEERPKDYGAMMDEALAESVPAVPVEPVAPVAPVASPVVPEQPMMGGVDLPPPPAPVAPMVPEMPPVVAQPVMPEAPVTPETPVIPTIDDSAAQLSVTAPSGVQVQPEPVNPVVVQPEQSPANTTPVNDPSAFRIPGM